MKKAIFAGSFDPIHHGHLKIIEKAANLFDELYVVVANNDFKIEQGDLDKRVEFAKKQIKQKNVFVSKIENKFIAKFAKEHGIKYLVRSARDGVDFRYELEMAKVNREINSEIETVLIIPSYEDIEYRSSKFRAYNIKEQREIFNSKK